MKSKEKAFEQQLRNIAETSRASTAKLEASVSSTNAQISATLGELNATTAALTAQLTNLTAQVGTIASELTEVGALLKNLTDRMDNVETNRVAPGSKYPRTEATAAAASC